MEGKFKKYYFPKKNFKFKQQYTKYYNKNNNCTKN